MGNTWSRDLASSACHATWQYHTRLAQYTFSNFLWQSAVRCLQVLAAGFVLLIEGGQWFWPPVRVGFVRDLPGTPYQLPGGEELCSFGPKWPNFLHSIGPYDIIWIKYDKVPCLAAMAACQSVRFVSMCFVIITVWVWSKPKKQGRFQTFWSVWMFLSIGYGKWLCVDFPTLASGVFCFLVPLVSTSSRNIKVLRFSPLEILPSVGVNQSFSVRKWAHLRPWRHAVP